LFTPPAHPLPGNPLILPKLELGVRRRLTKAVNRFNDLSPENPKPDAISQTVKTIAEICHPNLKLGENEMVQFHRVSEAGSVASLLG